MVRDDFPRLIVRRWRESVMNDFRNRTILHQDEDSLEEKIVPYSRYGTTLIAAIVTRTQVIYAQIGDGDIVLLRKDASYELLSPIYPNLVGGATFSLSGDDAIRLFSCGNSSVAGMRGLKNCYEEDSAFIRLLSAIADMVEKEGLELSSNIIREQFVQFSKNGSGDDITLVAVIVPSSSTKDASPLEKEDVNAENKG
jgi:hypothetical protein